MTPTGVSSLLPPPCARSPLAGPPSQPSAVQAPCPVTRSARPVKLDGAGRWLAWWGRGLLLKGAVGGCPWAPGFSPSPDREGAGVLEFSVVTGEAAGGLWWRRPPPPSPEEAAASVRGGREGGGRLGGVARERSASYGAGQGYGEGSGMGLSSCAPCPIPHQDPAPPQGSGAGTCTTCLRPGPV